jgi:hypothetical protein
MASARSQLVDATRSRRFVRLLRRFEKTAVRGYVLDVGPQFFLLLLVSDRIWFDGFECLRIADIRSMKPDPHAAFVEAALRKRRARRPRKPPVSVRSVAGMVKSAGRAFPLVAVHREEIDSSVCWIGRVLRVREGRVSLLEIDPAAKWRDRATEFRLTELTRLGFGGDYESALHLVAGKPVSGPADGLQKSR